MTVYISAAQVRRDRKGLGETQEEFAQRHMVRQTTVWRWEETGIRNEQAALRYRYFMQQRVVSRRLKQSA